jgi:hypothetical protein
LNWAAWIRTISATRATTTRSRRILDHGRGSDDRVTGGMYLASRRPSSTRTTTRADTPRTAATRETGDAMSRRNPGCQRKYRSEG